MIHEKLKKARKLSGLTQEQVAECLGVTQATVSQFESGDRNPQPTHITIMEALYKIRLDDEDILELERARLRKNIEGLTPKHIKILNDLIEALKQ